MMNTSGRKTINHDISGLLGRARTVAVIGISDNPSRASYRIGSDLLRRGYTVYPVNPKLETWRGIPAYPDLASAPSGVDIVNVFRRSEHVAGIVDEAIAAGARALWLQLGVVDEKAALKALDAGLDVVMDRCISVELSAL